MQKVGPTGLGLIAFGLAMTIGLPAEAQSGLDRLEAELERLVSVSGGEMGIAAYHLETDRQVVIGRGDTFPMASTYKVPIAVQLLTRVDNGELSLTDMIGTEPDRPRFGVDIFGFIFSNISIARGPTKVSTNGRNK